MGDNTVNSLRSDRRNNLLELIVVLLLGVTTIASSFAAFQASLNEGEASASYNEGVATITNANSLYISAGQRISNDMSLYQSLLLLNEQVDNAEASADKEKLQKMVDDFSAKFINEELTAAIKWSKAQEAKTGVYTSPFESQDYLTAIYTDAEKVYESGQKMLENGHAYKETGERMGLIVIYFATVLFLLGVCNAIRNIKIKLGLMGFSTALFVFAAIQLFSIPLLTP